MRNVYRFYYFADQKIYFVDSIKWKGDKIKALSLHDRGVSLNADIDSGILMQGTSLFDSGGRLIFEGDILLIHPDINCKVVFDSGAFCIKDLGRDYNDFTPLQQIKNEQKVKVIGNVYQHLER